jgi:hypothetical protein
MFTIVAHVENEPRPVCLPGFTTWVAARIVSQLLLMSLDVTRTEVVEMADQPELLPAEEAKHGNG